MTSILTKQGDVTKRSVPILRSKRKLPRRTLLSRTPTWVFIGLLLVVEVYPLLWLMLSSFKTNPEFTLQPFWSLPSSLDWQNYVDAWNSGMNVYFLNSILA